jgi:arginase
MADPHAATARPDRSRGAFVAAPLNLGTTRPGTELAPLAVWRAVRERVAARPRDPSLAAVRELSFEPVSLPDRLDVQAALAGAGRPAHLQPAYFEAVAAACEQVARTVASVAAAKRPPVVVGGDHAVGIGTLAGLRRVYDRVGVVYVDAHADANNLAESDSGHVHGMVVAAHLGRPGMPAALSALAPPAPRVAPESLAYLALRDLDWGEKAYLASLPGLFTATALEVEAEGMARIVERLLAHFNGQQLDGLYVSLDVDALDPVTAPGTGVPVAGGLSGREVDYLVDRLSRQSAVPLLAFEIVEVNPTLDVGNRAVDLAARLICRCLGETVL